MLLPLSQPPTCTGAAGGALCLRRCSAPSALLPFANSNPPLFTKTAQARLPARKISKPSPAELARARPNSPAAQLDRNGGNRPEGEEDEGRVVVGDEGVPLEGVIQFDKPADGRRARLLKSAKVALLAGGDVLCLIAFSAIGRATHGFQVLDFETFRTADPFIAGWFLSAYFLGGYSENGRGENGYSNGLYAAVKSWALGIPLGIAIRSASSGRIPHTTFILVTLGSTAVLLIGWRAVICRLLSKNQNQRNDMYRRGSAFELFELLTSLIRRW